MYNNYINDGLVSSVKTNSIDTYKISLGDSNTKLYYNASNETTMKSSAKEQKDYYEIKIEAHGVEDVQLSYEKLKGLIIKGSKETLDGRIDVKSTFSIDEKIYDVEQISVFMNKGILTICINKKEEYKEKVLFKIEEKENVIKSGDNISKLKIKSKDINTVIDSIEVGEQNIEVNSTKPVEH